MKPGPKPGPGYRVIEEYILAEKAAGRKILKKTAARKLYARHPELWTSEEGCRSMLRALTGANDSGRYADRPDLEVPHGHQSDRPWDDLPEGMTYFDEWAPHPLEGSKILHLCDIHSPYHRRDALVAALEIGVKAGVDHVFLNGDIIDCHALSRWETDPRERDFLRELEVTRSILKTIREGFPDARITFKKGNHEERFERYMMLKAEELLSLPEFRLESLLLLKDYGIECVPDRRIVRIGKLNAIHGHELGRTISSPVNPARGLYNRGKAHSICGHWHRTSQHAETDLEGHTTTVYSVGALCDLHPRYLPHNNWNHGVAVIHVDDEGAFEVENYRIIKGRAFR